MALFALPGRHSILASRERKNAYFPEGVSVISTHILDTSRGLPAAGVLVSLERAAGLEWNSVGRELTNGDGRISFACPAEAGTYRLTFQIDAYFAQNQQSPFFTVVPVVFAITDTSRKYHIPLLLNPYGYSTYRGS